MAELLREVTRLRNWADAYPRDRRSGEWECEYDDWNVLHGAVLEFVAARSFADWSADELEAILYVIGRDNEMQHLAHQIRVLHPELLPALARASLRMEEPDAKWQLAEELGQLGQRGEEVEHILIALADDADEYVRRRALSALARIGSSAVEDLALVAWHKLHEYQQWSRMNALWCLHRVGSPLLDQLLAEAEQDDRPNLANYAKRLRKGQVDA